MTSAPSDNSRKYAVLPVDDDPLITAGTGAEPARSGYPVTTPNSGRVTLELLKKFFFDLVIVELAMTPVNGLEVFEGLKGDAAGDYGHCPHRIREHGLWH